MRKVCFKLININLYFFLNTVSQLTIYNVFEMSNATKWRLLDAKSEQAVALLVQ